MSRDVIVAASVAQAIAFAGSRIDRADHIRCDDRAVERLKDERARLLRLDGLDPVTGGDGRLVWGGLTDADPESELVFLGLEEDEAGIARACFAEVAPSLRGSVFPPTMRMWQALSALPMEELATYGGARSLVDWHARHRFCARCGGETVLAKGGWQRNCVREQCAGEHFPRVDPVTIMLVEHDGALLLGRQPNFPPHRYSALAGFVEPGESVEDAVIREVREETAVETRDVVYVASQPWPFPSALMIGCHAFADARDITLDTTELDDARWFSRAEVAEAVDAARQDKPGRAFHAPPRHAIANHLLRWWLAQE